MTGFDDREKALEAKFEHDEEVAFKVRSRRRRLLGLWAAEHLGLKGDGAHAYADELAALGLHRGGDDEAIQRIAGDFVAKGVALDVVRIKLESDHFEREAKAQVG